MGNGVGKLCLCYAGDPGEISRRHHSLASCLPDPLDEGLGHSFYYARPDPLQKTQSADDFSAQTTPFRSISGAAISANAFTHLSTHSSERRKSQSSLDKASAFESSELFSSIPLQPVPRNPSPPARFGPTPRNPGHASGSIERGFMSGPIERSFISGPLESHFDQLQRFKSKTKKWDLVKNFKNIISKSGKDPSFSIQSSNNDNNTTTISGNSSVSTINSHNLSSQMSLVGENDDLGSESFGIQNVQWAQGKAGEDRVHVVVSEQHGWVFVGIYDGFNGPDAADFLQNNLYSNVSKALKGLLWCDPLESCEITVNSWKSLDSEERVELDRRLREKLRNLTADHGIEHSRKYSTVDHLSVLKALSEALKKTEESYLQIADMMLVENPELSLMGSCVLVMVMKGDDVFLMNVGDSRAVLAELDSNLGKMGKKCDDSLYGSNEYEMEKFCGLISSCQITMDHSTCVDKEVRRIRNAHPDDAFAIHNGRVKGSLKVTRAFGAGFLKHPKWNNALLKMFRIDYVGTHPYITCSPSLYHHRLGLKDKFLILSSDGLYQYMTNDEAVSQVEMFMSASPEGDPAQHLVEQALFRAAEQAGMDFHELLDIPQGDRRRYHDDISIIIISLEGRIWRSSV